jgi:hypothetical protein
MLSIPYITPSSHFPTKTSPPAQPSKYPTIAPRTIVSTFNASDFGSRLGYSDRPVIDHKAEARQREANMKAWLSYEGEDTDTPAEKVPKRIVSNPTHRQNAHIKDTQVARGVTAIPCRQGMVTDSDTTTTSSGQGNVYGLLSKHLTPSSK